MLVDELVDNLGWKVNPDVKNTILISIFECFLQIFLNIWNDDMGSSKVVCVPFAIWLPLGHSLLTDTPVGKEMVDELNWENFNIVKLLENWNVYVTSLRDI